MKPTKEQSRFIECYKDRRVIHKFSYEQDIHISQIFNLNENGEFEISFIQQLFTNHEKYHCLICQPISGIDKQTFKIVDEFTRNKDASYLLSQEIIALTSEKSTKTEHLKYAIAALTIDDLTYVEEYSPIEQVFTAIEIIEERKAANLITKALSTNKENYQMLNDLISEIILGGEIHKEDIDFLITILQKKLKAFK